MLRTFSAKEVPPKKQSWERQRMILRKKDDEDEGSSSRDEANQVDGFRSRDHHLEKIESSAEALRADHSPISFPPVKK
jgi:hypothetical protein